VNFIAINNDFSHLIEIAHALKNKEFVAIHGDRYLPGSKTMEQEFFNKPALFPSGPFLIPIKFDVPVVFVSAMKASPNHYHFFSTRPVNYNSIPLSQHQSNKEQMILQDYTQELEKKLIRYPEQWFNFYEFWKNDI